MITNKDIIDTAGALFAHTDAYNLPGTFANRDESRAFLEARLKAGLPEITLISDMLGTGKTALLQMVQGRLGLKDRRPFLCGRTKNINLDAGEPCFIDEWDIKATPRRILQTLTLVRDKMDTHPSPVVLVGDYTMRSSKFRLWLERISRFDYVPMEPLTPSFFDLAMSQRLTRVLASLNKEPEQDVIIEPELREALVPNWPDRTSANFRDVFKTLLEMAGKLPVLDDRPGRIGRREARLWLAEYVEPAMLEMSEQQRRFYEAYISSLRICVAGRGWPAVELMGEAELRDVTNFTDTPLDRFRIEITEPIARVGLLAAMGCPEISDGGEVYDRWPAPYLPGTATRVQVAFGGSI